MKIKDIKQEGKVSLLCLITKADKGKTQKNTPYLSLMLQDSTGQLDAKFWNLTEAQTREYQPGMIVEAKGDVIFHKNAPQLRVRSLKPVKDADLTQFVIQAPISRQEMESVVTQMVSEMDSRIIREIVQEILEKHWKEFFTYPAAVRNHHNFVGGLAYHTITMAKAARLLRTLYPWLNYDLLIAGILLHDVSKVEEYSSAVLPEYTAAGNLVGHISMVNNEIDRAAARLNVQDREEVTLLKHMVLSHHGRMEYGSPVLPMIPEAEMLTLLDNMDSRLFMMKNAQDTLLPGTFGPRIFALDNRMVYRPKGEEE